MEFNHHFWVFICGLIGNAISFMVFLSPMPTFYRIYKKKTTEGFQAIPYITALFSSTLWIYYAIFVKDATFLITINTFGIVIESIYLAIFLIYSTKKARLSTIKIILLLNVFGFGAIVLSTLYLTKGDKRVTVIGWFNLILNICVFASPLGSLRRVVKTKSVEFMPFTLSFFLTLNAVMWFFYGLLRHDYYIALPNTLGFLFGIIQMVMYMIYRKNKNVVLEEPVKLQELNNNNNNNNNGHVIDVVKLSTMVPSEPNHVAVNVTLVEDINGNNQEDHHDDNLHNKNQV
ncbi:bidirectional sugar transporter SWEET10 [Arachis hypogaea]|uniref:Bidirectional sugar transporter SWEET n=1 Tax=Arachis hypogaea TaxID=3818 RepID=A0A444XXI2_ARAHY|nr:bidirectional sugar transporter SWEET10 [Arachis hypogaea]QHN98224.1 Bidirectional sugar transporter [Arachis hypogaea]RYQ94146.1 hypothetical protein Ahy_B08g089026 [Arachis hypogaea]